MYSAGSVGVKQIWTRSWLICGTSLWPRIVVDANSNGFGCNLVNLELLYKKERINLDRVDIGGTVGVVGTNSGAISCDGCTKTLIKKYKIKLRD